MLLVDSSYRLVTMTQRPISLCSITDGVPITVYRSKNCSMVVAPSVFVYFHGGGNVVGSRKTVDAVCKIFSR